jgi:hypothetical protein
MIGTLIKSQDVPIIGAQTYNIGLHNSETLLDPKDASDV